MEEMKEMLSILTPFVEITNRLQSDSVTSSLVISSVICLYKGGCDLLFAILLLQQWLKFLCRKIL
jgi:hypothetical protein